MTGSGGSVFGLLRVDLVVCVYWSPFYLFLFIVNVLAAWRFALTKEELFVCIGLRFIYSYL